MVLTPCIWVTSYYHPALPYKGKKFLPEASPPTLETMGLYTITWMKYSLQSTSNSVKPSFDLFNIMAMIQ
jgi:hypothetical protein